MKLKNIFIAFALVLFALTSCSEFLEREPDTILSDDQVFGDEVMIKSVLSNFYGRITWGQHIDDSYSYTILDEASRSESGPDTRQGFEDNRWRVYDYTLMRNLNQFLKGVRETDVLDADTQKMLEGEARFIRAWLYFNMARGMGGMPIIGDEVFEYSPGMDITTLQYPRSTEAEIYNYIISECEAIKNFLPENPSINAARATKWAALMLKARAAVYAGSIANYNNKMPNPIKTPGGEVGIDANLAQGYYQTALSAAEEVINSGKYELQLNKPDDRGRNFYEALSVKENNKEVIWARDYKYPGQTNGFTQINIPASHAEDIDRAYAGPILNLRSEEHTSELQSRPHLVCRLLLEKRKPKGLFIWSSGRCRVTASMSSASPARPAFSTRRRFSRASWSSSSPRRAARPGREVPCSPP